MSVRVVNEEEEEKERILAIEEEKKLNEITKQKLEVMICIFVYTLIVQLYS